MIHSRQQIPLFREAEFTGYVGIRGYFGYLQDIITAVMHELDKNQYTLNDVYGAAWIFTRYRVKSFREIGYEPLTITGWGEKHKSTRSLTLDCEVISEGELAAVGRVDTCIYNLKEKRIERLEFVDYPLESEDEREPVIDGWMRIPRNLEGMEKVHSHKVVYTDLDSTRHLNNLLYVNLFLNAFDSNFHDEQRICDMQLNFIDQCYEGETVDVLRKDVEDGIILFAVHADGSTAAQCKVVVEPR